MGQLQNNTTEKTYKTIIVGYVENHTRNTYKLYNPETDRVIMTGGVKCSDCKMTNSVEILKILRDAHKEGLLPGIEKDKIPISEPEDKISV